MIISAGGQGSTSLDSGNFQSVGDGGEAEVAGYDAAYSRRVWKGYGGRLQATGT